MLDETQKEIVNTQYDKVLVVSGGGAGKTRVIIERIKKLLSDGVNPKDIVAITFTNAAADEMRERLDGKGKEVFLGTIHGYANRLLLLNGQNTASTLKEDNFDELFELVKKHPNCIQKVNYLLVDEFQDIDDLQYEFLFNMIQPKEFFVVGDDYQNIYGWRGSNVEHFFDLAYDPMVQMYKLENNYRTGSNIVSFAFGFIAKVRRKINKNVYCMNPNSGELIELKNASYDGIVREIEKDTNYSNWYVLTRTNAQVTEMIQTLIEHNIPAQALKRNDFSSQDFKKILSTNSVKVMTAHSAKGLENEKVAVIGLSPYNDEERRLCYVAATRAKNKLVWCYKKPKKVKHVFERWE